MGFWSWMTSGSSVDDGMQPGIVPAVGQEVSVRQGMPDINLMKIEGNIARFERAIDQCNKGPERLDELHRNLAYWKAMREAHVLKEGR